MNRVIQLQSQLLEAQGAIGRLAQSIRDNPTSKSLKATAHSMQKRLANLEEEFLVESNALGIDVCSYRLIPAMDEQPSLKAIGRVFIDFQTLVSVVYDAVKNSRQKDRARIGTDSTLESTFNFGYTFSGSIGVVLTIPNERLLGIDSWLDESLHAIFEMVKANDATEIRAFAGTLGSASIKSLYDWASGHAQYGLGVDIQWRRERLIRNSLFAQKLELDQLCNVIDKMSDETIEELVVTGELAAADVTRKTFKIDLPDKQGFQGTFDDAISHAHTVTIPRKYRAYLTKSSRLQYSTDKTVISYFLRRLEDVP